MREPQKRQLIALMFSDIVGYAAITTENERLALELLQEYQAIFRRVIPYYGGRENKTIGDAFFVEFGSTLEAVLCAIEIQTALYERNLTVPHDEKLQARIGIHLGDVVLSHNDSFGEGVNIAARIEGFADPGGICVSRQVADQLVAYDSIRLRPLGKKALKHIRSRTELFKVELPWERRAISRWFGEALNLPTFPELATGESAPAVRWLLAIALTILVVFGYLGARTFADFHSFYAMRGKQLKRLEVARIYLMEGWQYALAPYDEPVDPAGRGNAFFWNEMLQPFTQYAEQLTQPYWMRRELLTERGFDHPAIVLGPFSGAHRVYLNGSFIGGSESVFTLAYYPFDPRLLRTDKANTILVKVNPRPSITPGFVTLPSVGTFIGAFSDIYALVALNEFYFHTVQSVYLALAFALFLACLMFWAFNPADRKYLYFTLYLLLGCMTLLHSNGFVCAFLDYRLQRAFRLFGLALSSVLLLSAYFHLVNRPRAETANNAFGLAVAAGLVGSLLVHENSAQVYLDKWNTILALTAAYTAIWVVAVINYRTIRITAGGHQAQPGWSRLGYEALVVIFGCLIAMLAFSSAKTPWTALFPKAWLAWFFTLGTVNPFLFAAGVLGMGTLDYILKDGSVRRRRKADDLLLGLSEIVRQQTDPDALIESMQKRISDFVEAERSTVYLWHQPPRKRPKLHAVSVLGSPDSRAQVSREISPDGGLVGYVCQTQNALLIRNLASDVRFQGHVSNRPPGSYKTGSCMLFPLVIGRQLVGVLTVADKQGQRKFNRRDFSILSLAAKDLALTLYARGGRVRRVTAKLA